MPEIPAVSPDPTCSDLIISDGVEQNQSLGPDRFSLRAPAREREAPAEGQARDGRGRFAKGHSGNPGGRPPGIPNPQRRVIGLRAWRENRPGVLAIAARKPWLLQPLLVQAFPPLRPPDPARRLGTEIAGVTTPDDAQRVAGKVWRAMGRGDIAALDGARLMRRVYRRLRQLRRLALIERRVARLTNKAGPPPPLS